MPRFFSLHRAVVQWQRTSGTPKHIALTPRSPWRHLIVSACAVPASIGIGAGTGTGTGTGWYRYRCRSVPVGRCSVGGVCLMCVNNPQIGRHVKRARDGSSATATVVGQLISECRRARSAVCGPAYLGKVGCALRRRTTRPEMLRRVPCCHHQQQRYSSTHLEQPNVS